MELGPKNKIWYGFWALMEFYVGSPNGPSGLSSVVKALPQSLRSCSDRVSGIGSFRAAWFLEPKFRPPEHGSMSLCWGPRDDRHVYPTYIYICT